MANYSKIKSIKLPQSHIRIAVEGIQNLEEQKDIEELGRRTEKLRREAAERLDKDNALESKTAQDHHLCLQPGKRLETWPSCEGGFPEQDQKSRERSLSAREECYLIITALLCLGNSEVFFISLSLLSLCFVIIIKYSRAQRETQAIIPPSSSLSVALKLNSYFE